MRWLQSNVQVTLCCPSRRLTVRNRRGSAPIWLRRPLRPFDPDVRLPATALLNPKRKQLLLQLASPEGKACQTPSRKLDEASGMHNSRKHSKRYRDHLFGFRKRRRRHNPIRWECRRVVTPLPRLKILIVLPANNQSFFQRSQ